MKREDRFVVAVSAMLSCSTLREASRQTGIPEGTLRKWQQDPDFQHLYQETKDGIVHTALNALRQKMSQAVDVLAEIMNDSGVPPAQRVSAARAVLETGLKAVDTQDIMKRLEALENAENDRNRAIGGSA